MIGNDNDNDDTARALDAALADTFPASDPPSQTTPSVATPSASYIGDSTRGELRFYRVIQARQASDPFAPSEAAGRWTPLGVRCTYVSLSAATALLEYLVHLEGRTPKDLLLAVGVIPAESVLSEINEPSTWCELPYRPEVQQVGAAWIASARSPGLRVPSALCRDECNLLLNPDHPGFAAMQLVALRPMRVDERIRT